MKKNCRNSLSSRYATDALHSWVLPHYNRIQENIFSIYKNLFVYCSLEKGISAHEQHDKNIIFLFIFVGIE